MRARTLWVAVVVMLTACGDAGGDTTTIATSTPDAPTSTTAPTTTAAPDVGDDNGGAADQLPAECIAEITAFLQVIEPFVEGLDFETLTDEELVAAFGDDVDLLAEFDPEACPDDDDTESARAAWLEIAQQVAPGAIGYVEYIYSDD